MVGKRVILGLLLLLVMGCNYFYISTQDDQDIQITTQQQPMQTNKEYTPSQNLQIMEGRFEEARKSMEQMEQEQEEFK